MLSPLRSDYGTLEAVVGVFAAVDVDIDDGVRSLPPPFLFNTYLSCSPASTPALILHVLAVE
jgi:hypothetical protein